ncbi:hypothetical protein J4Q44_G00366250 [Coregonus suidteri]|uniref:Uncharacterized protein n=1 Tax=Coregonus suidteri TaxID=861788 RepID=A0AAN8KDW1_9TELE
MIDYSESFTEHQRGCNASEKQDFNGTTRRGTTCMTFWLSSLLRPIRPQQRRPSSNSGPLPRLSCSAPLWHQLLPQQKRIALKSSCWIQLCQVHFSQPHHHCP